MPIKKIYRNCEVRIYSDPDRIWVKDKNGRTVLDLSREVKEENEL